MTRSSTAETRTTAPARTPTARPSGVAALRPRETMAFDQARLVEVCDRHGTGAEAYIAATLDAVEAAIAEAEARSDEPAVVAGRCSEIAVLADAIGMITIRHAAAAVLDCLAHGSVDGPAERTARAACLQRLARLGRPGGTGGWAIAAAPGPDPAA